MTGTLKLDGETWYVEYIDATTSAFSTGEPSKFALRADNIEKIINGTWEAWEGKSVSFELQSLPQFPFYEVDLKSSDMRKSMFGPSSSLAPNIPPSKTVTRYRYHVKFNDSSQRVECDKYYRSDGFYHFKEKRRLEKPYTDGYGSLIEYDYDDIAIFPASRTAIYRIEKYEVEEKN